MLPDQKDFFKKLIDDYFEFLKAPKEFLKRQLNDFDSSLVDKSLVVFVVLMHSYFVFLPSFLLGTNLMSLILVFFYVGVLYFTSQICLQNHQENIGINSFDSKKLYVFAYAFSLAELTGLFLNIIILFFNLTHIFSFVGWLLGFFFMIPVALVVAFLKLSIFKVVEPEALSIVTLFRLSIEALIETIRGKFAFDAWRELWADFNSEET